MHLKSGFTFIPLEQPNGTPAPVDPQPHYGPLDLLVGHWAGSGFNMITRPYFEPGNTQNHFLELNLTNETIDFAYIEGAIPNRGRLQGDINMYGLTYLQQVSDANLSTPTDIVGLHAEPGVWANVPATTDPAEPPSIVRMASIPHGTVINAQGTVAFQEGVPHFDEPEPPYPNGINATTGATVDVPEAELAVATPYRSSGKQVEGITQAMVSFPVDTFLNSIVKKQKVLSTTTLSLSTDAGVTSPKVSCGGGTANTAFLAGAPGSGPNALGTRVDSTFWIEEVAGENGEPDFWQLQYRQTVFLQFAGVLWPHVSVATLRKQPVELAVPPRAPGVPPLAV